jgi:hypothetical protein
MQSLSLTCGDDDKDEFEVMTVKAGEYSSSDNVPVRDLLFDSDDVAAMPQHGGE